METSKARSPFRRIALHQSVLLQGTYLQCHRLICYVTLLDAFDGSLRQRHGNNLGDAASPIYNLS